MTLLYHGTNGEWLSAIMRHGLRPRGNLTKGNWTNSMPSNPKCVYLTDSYAPYFAFQASRGKEPSCAVIEVDTDRLNQSDLFPDEDFLEQASRKINEAVPGTMKERTRHYRKIQFNYNTSCVMPDGEPTTWWQVSLKHLGTCAHRGPIPASAITRAVYWPHKQNIKLMFVWDPSITLLNQQVVGDRYRALTAKLFSGTFATDEENVEYVKNPMLSFSNPLLPPIEDWQLIEAGK